MSPHTLETLLESGSLELDAARRGIVEDHRRSVGTRRQKGLLLSTTPTCAASRTQEKKIFFFLLCFFVSFMTDGSCFKEISSPREQNS